MSADLQRERRIRIQNQTTEGNQLYHYWQLPIIIVYASSLRSYSCFDPNFEPRIIAGPHDLLSILMTALNRGFTMRKFESGSE